MVKYKDYYMKSFFRYLDDRVFYLKSFILYGRKHYDTVEKECIHRYEKYGGKIIYYEIFTHVYYYKGKFELCLKYFKLWLENSKSIRSDIIDFFINEIFGRFNGGKFFEMSISYGKELVSLIRNYKSQILLLHYMSVAYYQLKNYKEALKVIDEIEALDPNDEHIAQKRSKIQETIAGSTESDGSS